MDDTREPTDQPPDADEAGRRQRAALAGAILLMGLAAVLVAATTVGFGPYEDTARAARPPTLWDWLQLLIVPAVLALGAIWFNKTQKNTELKIAEKARAEDRDIARQARESEQQIAADRLRQTTLEAYYDRMTELLLEHGLRGSEENSEARSIARARTVAVVKGLDGERNRQLLAFLRTSQLFDKNAPVVDLDGADLSGADLSGVDLSAVNLSNAYLTKANLYRANLRKVNLGGAILGRANLGAVNLDGANLSTAFLLEANLSGANLSRANLSEANLSGANLSRADLSGASLSGASLSWADLHGARNWTLDKLYLAKTLEGATMPDGRQLKWKRNPDGPTYEEWKATFIKDRNQE